MNPSKFEWATLPLNPLSLVLRGQVALLMSVLRNAPFGCSGNENQKPFSSEPAATLSMKVLSGLVIQKADTVLSEGSRVSLADMLTCRMVWRFSVSSPFAARLDGDAWLARMALGLDGEVADELVAVLDAILEEEAVAHGVCRSHCFRYARHWCRAPSRNGCTCREWKRS